MKYCNLLSILFCILLLLFFCSNAIVPEHYIGTWSTSDRSHTYYFENGIIEQIYPTETAQIDGAYIFSRNSITLFISDHDGLNTVQELYWEQYKDQSILCDKPYGRDKKIILWKQYAK